jgi:glycosyltransferase involved in cell wall biosynthesis
MIVRDESKNLSACLAPVSKLFDEIIVVDTGSTDATKKIARRYGAKVVDSPWKDDFAAARNETLRHATGEYIFWLDADDRIDAANAKLLGSLFNSLDGSREAHLMTTVCKLANRASEPLNVSHARLFRAHDEARWRYRIHEQILPCLQRLGYGIVETEIVIQHTGYQDAVLQHRKIDRALKLCRLDYAEAPQDPVVLYHLGTTLLQRSEFSGALQYLLKCLRFAGKSPWIAIVYAQAVSAFEALGRKSEARQFAMDGLERFPGDYELSLKAAQLLLDEGAISQAEQTLRSALGRPVRGYLESRQPNRVLRCEIRRVLARVYLEQQRFDESESLLQQLLIERPHDLFVWVTLGYLYVTKKSWREVQFVIRQLRKLQNSTPYACCLEAEILKERGEAEAAKPWLRQAIAAAPDMLLPRMLTLEVTTATLSSIVERRQAARDVLRLSPDDEVARRVLNDLERLSGICGPVVITASTGRSVPASS